MAIRLGVWLAGGVFCFAGSQILGKGLVGWWPFRGHPGFLVRLVRVETAPSSANIALVAFAGFSEPGRASVAKLFVADRDGKEIAEVCDGPILDIRWSRNGKLLYFLRSETVAGRGPPRSLWRYTAPTRQLAHVRNLPRPATVICLDPSEQTLLFTGPRLAGGEERFPLLQGPVAGEKADRTVCWREGLQIGHTWGPKTHNMFVATSKSSSFGQDHGLWMIQNDDPDRSPSVPVLDMDGIEGIRFNPAETFAALFVRYWPPRYVDFDLYVLDLREGAAIPVAPAVEWGAAVWDAQGDRLVFADREGLWSYRATTGRLRLVMEAPPDPLNPDRPERLKPLSCDSWGNIVYQRGNWRLERYARRSGKAKTVLHTGKLRRYFAI
jgi:hypothetical protein